MGASEDGGIGVDCGVGTIVWVRRRNGSWWPGRILGPEELSASHLMSPRSGTPVKLLGREDASVDWYNLEKSKRVKAFRCGEFDACIERAEASQGVPIKKREKYARREDAILHALELEKQQLAKKQHKLGNSSNSVNHNSGALKKELNSYSPGLYTRNDESVVHRKIVNPKSQVLPRRSDLLPEELSGGHPLLAQNGKYDREPYCQDDNSEAIPRMRGLQDFGLQIAPSKRKLSTSANCEGARKPVLVDNHVHVLPGSGHGLGSVTNVGSGKSSLAFKKKRSPGGLSDESLVKRRDRRRPLVQVLQSSAKLPASQSLQSNSNEVSILVQEEKENMGAICRAKRSRCIYLPVDSSDCLDHTEYSPDQMPLLPAQFGCSNGLHRAGSLTEEETSSGLIEEDDTDSSGRDCMDPDNHMEEEATLLQDSKSAPGSRFSGRYGRDSSSAFCNEEKPGTSTNHYETSLINYKSHLHSHEQSVGTSADVGVSKWHMKGKRNIRNLTRRPMEVLDGKDSAVSVDKCNGSVNGTTYESRRSIFKMGRERAAGQANYLKGAELDCAFDEDDFFEKDLDNEFVGFGNPGYPSMLKPPSRDCSNSGLNNSDEDSHEMLSSGWEADGTPHMARRAYWGEREEFFDAPYIHPINVCTEPMLVDVDLKVQASYQGEHVPLVSLMSRLNGKAIIGHPVHIEILEDGSSDLQLPRNGLAEGKTGFGENSAPPSVWRTGRRTAMQRVPRSHPTPSALEAEDVHPIRFSDLESKPPFKKPFVVPKNQARSTKKSSHRHRSTSGKSHKKSSKKASLSSQKTRTLSSIATEQKRSSSNVNSKLANKDGSILDGLIKADSSVPLVACVPVKVVFSRILEAVGRPPSAAATNRSLLTGLAERNPS